MFFVLSKIIDVGASPIFWAIGLLGGALYALRRNRPRRSAGFVLGAIAILVLFSLPNVKAGLYRGLESSAKNTSRPVTYDAVVILGGMVDGSEGDDPENRVGLNDSVERLTTGYELLKSGRAENAIVTGISEADGMKLQLVRWGIDPDRIIVEPFARNTAENAARVKVIADREGFDDLVMVTSAFHMLRATECFRGVGRPVDTIPSDFRARALFGGGMPRAAHLAGSETALREYVGRMIYRVQGYSKAE